jgi:ABC-type sugar transport system substrate-binding protein|tara:strand:+ start:205 stop:504 length:300 start_codon:yes stop_codon:yes gene_type:complete
MNKFIFFQNQANDCMVYPLRRLQSVEGKDDALDFSFESSATGNDVVTVTLSDDSDELLAMQATAQLINKHPHSDGIIVVADDVNSVYAHSSMTAVGAAG